MPDLPIEVWQLVVASLIVFVGTVLQGSIGFGLGTLGVPLLLLVYPGFVPAPMLMLAFVLTVSVYLRERGSVARGEVGWGILGRVLGAFLGAGVVRMVAGDTLVVVIAFLVLAGTALVQSGLRVSINRPNLVGVGILSGIMGTAASIGGPPMAMLYSGEKGPRVRGTLSGIFVAGTLSALIALWSVGRLGLEELTLAGLLLPANLSGIFASRYSARWLDRGFVRPAILTLSGAAACLIIARYFL